MKKSKDTQKRESILLGKPLLITSSTNGRRSYDLDTIKKDRNKWKLSDYKEQNDLIYSGDSHLLTIAPTGSGKGRSAIIPNLLNYVGPVIVIDPKGENYAVTAIARRKLGHQVYKLDPFNIIDENSDSLNPLDIFDLQNTDIISDAQMLADILSTSNTTPYHRYWDISACALLTGVIGYISNIEKLIENQNQEEEVDDDDIFGDDDDDIFGDDDIIQENDIHKQKRKKQRHKINDKKKLDGKGRNFTTLVEELHSDDVVYNLSVVIDKYGKTLPRMIRGEISDFLNKADKERSGVLSSANSYLKAFTSERVLLTLDKSSFSLKDIVDGKPISIYVIIPPDKLNSHKSIIKLWIGTLMKAILSRKHIPEKKTLFILDECAQLGTFPFLETVITLSRGYGMQAWTFWQDLSQIKNLYKISWETILNNSGVLQFFGSKNFADATKCASFIGVESDEIRSLRKTEQIIVIDGKPLKTQKYDYLNDTDFIDKFEDNPFYINVEKI